MFTIKRISHLLIILVTACCAASPCFSEEKEERKLEPEQALSLISAYSWTNTLPRHLIDLQNAVEERGDFKGIEKQLPDISKRIETLEWESVSLKSNPNLTYHDLISFEAELLKVKRQLEEIDRPVRDHIQNLEQWYKSWLEKEQQINQLIKQIAADPGLVNTAPAIRDMTKTVNTRICLPVRKSASTRPASISSTTPSLIFLQISRNPEPSRLPRRCYPPCFTGRSTNRFSTMAGKIFVCS